MQRSAEIALNFCSGEVRHACSGADRSAGLDAPILFMRKPSTHLYLLQSRVELLLAPRDDRYVCAFSREEFRQRETETLRPTADVAVLYDPKLNQRRASLHIKDRKRTYFVARVEAVRGEEHDEGADERDEAN